MTFTEALTAAFKDDDRVTRTDWHNRNIYISVVEGRLCITGFSHPDPDDGRPHPLIVTESDFFAEDWEILADG